MNLVGLLEPIRDLIPAPMVPGACAALPTDVAGEIAAVVQRADSALHGDAGRQISSTLSQAKQTAQEVMDAGKKIDQLAGSAVEAVNHATRDITFLAQDCLAQLGETLVSSIASGGPLAGLPTAKMLAIAEDHRQRAEERLHQLGQQLGDLEHKIRSVSIPSAGESPRSSDSAAMASGFSPPQPGHTAVPQSGSTPGDRLAADHTATTDPGTAHDPPTGEPSVAGAPTPQAAKAVEAAISAVGTPYQWGGNTPGVGLDCSGLTQWAYAQAGVDIPRVAEAQTIGSSVPLSAALPGDLVVWDGHVAMVIGDGQMVEAGDPVQINPIRTDNIGMSFLGVFRPTG